MDYKKKKDDEEDKPKWYPTNHDVEDMKNNLKGYEQIRINGRIQTKFDQYCKTIGVLYFDEYGERIIYQPNDYKILSDIYWKLKGKEDADNEFILQNNPEKRLELIAKIKSMGVNFRFV